MQYQYQNNQNLKLYNATFNHNLSEISESIRNLQITYTFSISKTCTDRQTMRQLFKTANIEELEYLSIPDKHREGKRRHWAFLNHTCHYISYLKKISKYHQKECHSKNEFIHSLISRERIKIKISIAAKFIGKIILVLWREFTFFKVKKTASQILHNSSCT